MAIYLFYHLLFPFRIYKMFLMA
ncbi:rCG20056 [Rattus norvegicus]|uniref:RCG20056 n=1 Tax=Rattus norvegicus TaxID=10116 RepID=A6KU50_RAT|nr:rCG20056 [Rattus norvegicus]